MRISLKWIAVATLAALPVGAQTPTQPNWGEPLPGLTPSELASFFAGKDAFNLSFTEADGLGPVFNENSCGSCHNDPVAGGTGTTLVTRFGAQDKGAPFDPMDMFGGSLLQSEAINDTCIESVPPTANIVANRVTTLSLGLGLIEGIPDSVIVANEAASTGTIHWVPELESPPGSPLRPGRFGWKAQLATVLSFSGDATLMEMGITNPLVDTENAPNGDAALLAACDTVADPEDDGTFIDLVTAFQRLSAPPPQTPKSGMTGEQVFIDIGCADCHLATSYTTDASAPEAALQNAAFKPYSDFLLHDMAGLGDGIVQGDAGQTEIRTPPLWGLRDRLAQLHDGRSNQGTHEARVSDAILQHAGEGLTAAMAFTTLTPTETDQLMAFLDSLGRREFDSNGDLGITEDDFRNFRDCFTGPGAGSVTPDDPCAVHDIDQDGDVDLDDFDSFLTVYLGPQDDCDTNGEIDLVDLLTGAATDCNDNLVPDSCDIALATSDDLNGNGIPDECEFNGTFIRSDCNTDGLINIADAVSLLDFLFNPAILFVDCEVACDANSDAVINLADPIYSLSHQFSAGTPPAAPFPLCGVEPTPSGLGCTSFSACP